MFWKKKDKAEPEAKGKPAEPARQEAPRASEPPRQAAPQPQRAPAEPPRSVGGRGPGAALDTALTAARGAKGAPVSPESAGAQTRGADALASATDKTLRSVAADIAGGRIEQGFDALHDAAAAAKSADLWRMLGQLAFNVDAGRAKWAYEHLFDLPPRQFWDCIFLARLRGMGRQLPEAREAAQAALAAAGGDAERGAAEIELGLIAYASNASADAIRHAERALALGKSAGVDGREMIGRQLLLADATLRTGDLARARTVYAEALDAARKLGAASPQDTLVARGVCEVLERTAAAATAAQDHIGARTAIEEALHIRRRLQAALPGTEGRRGTVQTLNLKGETTLAAGDEPAALAAFKESIALGREISAAAPSDPVAQRELWTVMWRVAQMNGGVGWRDVAQTMERMQSTGGLDEEAVRFLGEARRRAAA